MHARLCVCLLSCKFAPVLTRLLAGIPCPCGEHSCAACWHTLPVQRTQSCCLLAYPARAENTVVLLARDTPVNHPTIKDLNLDMTQWQPIIEVRLLVLTICRLS